LNRASGSKSLEILKNDDFLWFPKCLEQTVQISMTNRKHFNVRAISQTPQNISSGNHVSVWVRV
jgi:hypothetical protein